jgi:hypothetical protein
VHCATLARLQAYPGPDLLLVADPEARCGENFFLCLTLESRTAQEQVSPEAGHVDLAGWLLQCTR